MIFTYAIETVIIAMAALMAIDFGTRLGTAAHNARITASGTNTPAPQNNAPQRSTAPAEYIVEYVGYNGAAHSITPEKVSEPLSTELVGGTTNGWLDVIEAERPMPPRRILGDVIKSKGDRPNKLSDLIRTEAARPKDGIVNRTDHTYDLPDSIRGLRQYVRDNKLQKHIKEHTGKTVSRATKSELLTALAKI